MAKVTISDSYIGRAPKAIKWEELLVIFDTLFGAGARSLPRWPNASDTVNASWTNAAGIEYEANSLEEVRQAYEGFETSFIYFRRSIHSPQCHFKYWPAKAEAFIEVHVSEQETACRLIEIVRKKFPLVAKYVFISYADEESEIATFMKNILEKLIVVNGPTCLDLKNPPLTDGMGVSVKTFQYLAFAPKKHRNDYLVFAGLPFLDPKSELFQTWAESCHNRVAMLIRL